MTMGAFTAGVIIVCLTALSQIFAKEHEEEQKVFENE